jgi:hypothetical protein
MNNLRSFAKIVIISYASCFCKLIFTTFAALLEILTDLVVSRRSEQ